MLTLQDKSDGGHPCVVAYLFRGPTTDRITAMETSTPLRVSDNPEQQRYEAWSGDELAGFAA